MTITIEQLTAHQLAHLRNFQAFGIVSEADAVIAREQIAALVCDIAQWHADWMRDAPSIPALLWRYGEEPDCLPPFFLATAGQFAVSCALTDARERTGMQDIAARENFAGGWVVFWPGNTMGVGPFHDYKGACLALAGLRGVTA